MILMAMILGGSYGRSLRGSAAMRAIFFTKLRSWHCPKMVCLPLRWGVGTSVTKKCEPLVLGPLGHRQPPGLVEGEGGTELIFEAISRIARSIAYRIAALNHEIRDDPVEDSAIVERHTLHHLAGLRVLPGFCPSRQPDKVRDG